MNGRWELLLPDYRQDQWTHLWEVERLESMHRNIVSTDIIYEAGTECGDMSCLFASWGRGIVMAEPSKEIFPNIRATFEANDLAYKVLGTWVGFFDDHTDPGTLNLEQGDPWPPCSVGPLIDDHMFANVCERPDMARITIDEMASMVGRRPTVLTIDTEGSELRVLRGAQQTLTDDRPLVWVSVHPSFMFEMYDDSPSDISKLMADHGYESHLIAHDHEVHFLYYPKELYLLNGVVQR